MLKLMLQIQSYACLLKSLTLNNGNFSQVDTYWNLAPWSHVCLFHWESIHWKGVYSIGASGKRTHPYSQLSAIQKHYNLIHSINVFIVFQSLYTRANAGFHLSKVAFKCGEPAESICIQSTQTGIKFMARCEHCESLSEGIMHRSVKVNIQQDCLMDGVVKVKLPLPLHKHILRELTAL